MSLLDKASLIVTPNAYKESKLYSVVPNTTLGDMDVVRATTATRVNSAGLIEVVPRNLLTYSQDFTNASWSKSGVTITANTTVAPNGTTTASKLVEDGFLVTYGVYKGITTGFRYSHSIYAKKGERDWIKVNAVHGGNQSVWFNLANGTIGTNNTTGTPSIENVGNGWYRCAVNNTDHSFAASFFSVMPCTNNNIETYTGTIGNGIFIWGAQLDQGTTATEYFPTTTRLNIPRIDYTNGSCPSILVEPQRTNSLTYSSLFSNAAWAKQNTSITDNSIISPDGNLNAGKFVANSVNTLHAIYNGIGAYTGTYTFSVYAKKGEYDFLILQDQFSSVFYNTFNLSTGAIVSGSNSTIKSVGNGWFRCTVTFTATATTVFPTITISPNTGASYLGNSASGGYLYGAQMEIGAYATSYIPTVASSVTRNADVISKTGISSLINSLEGVLFVDLQFFTGLGGIRSINISNGSNNNRIGFYGHPSIANRIDFAIASGGVITDINFGGVTLTNRNKVLIRYSGTTFTGFVNGVKSANQTFTPFTANFLNRIGLDYGEDILRYEGRINSIQLYKTALTDAECIALTTL